MRVLACALIVAALTGVASADNDDGADDDDDDGAFVPMPKRSMGLWFGGHATRLGGMPESGMGPTLELALGNGRWQYIADGGFTSSTLTTGTSSSTNPDVGGRMWHFGGGLRWLARQFRPDGGGGIELFLASRAAYDYYSLDDGTRIGRPELGLGFGLQGRLYKRPRLAFRLDVHLLFAPDGNEDRVVACHGRCMNAAGASTGFATGVGLAW